MRKLVLLTALLLGVKSQAQLTITTGLDTASMSNLLEGLGVDISNMTINCSPAAYGQFNGYSEVPIANGLVFSTGDAAMMADSNMSSSTSTAWGYPGDGDLDALIGTGMTYDACVLEFDAVPSGDTLYFNFAFGSEEYMEFAGAGFNDVFAIFISGAGFSGPTNIAVLPNDTIVSIDNVNANINPQYYIDNETVPGSYVSFDGFTVNINVEAVVVPSTPYHFKIAIADVMDEVLDSGVMLEAFSFRSTMESLSVEETILQTRLFPNPANGQISIRFNEPVADIEILNALGTSVFASSSLASGTALDLSELPSGSYFVKVSSGAKNSIQPLVIIK